MFGTAETKGRFGGIPWNERVVSLTSEQSRNESVRIKEKTLSIVGKSLRTDVPIQAGEGR